VTKPSSKALQNYQRMQSSVPDSWTSPVAFRSYAWEILKDLYLPHAQPTHDINYTATSCYSWVHAVCHLDLRSHVLDRSLLAFCAIQNHISEPWSIPRAYALELYSHALSELVKSLDLHHERSQDETLGAIVVLSTCEVQPYPSPSNYTMVH
jgi:hypothetical protein